VWLVARSTASPRCAFVFPIQSLQTSNHVREQLLRENSYSVSSRCSFSHFTEVRFLFSIQSLLSAFRWHRSALERPAVL
jgi:hypothetical protein